MVLASVGLFPKIEAVKTCFYHIGLHEVVSTLVRISCSNNSCSVIHPIRNRLVVGGSIRDILGQRYQQLQSGVPFAELFGWALVGKVRAKVFLVVLFRSGLNVTVFKAGGGNWALSCNKNPEKKQPINLIVYFQ